MWCGNWLVFRLCLFWRWFRYFWRFVGCCVSGLVFCCFFWCCVGWGCGLVYWYGYWFCVRGLGGCCYWLCFVLGLVLVFLENGVLCLRVGGLGLLFCLILFYLFWFFWWNFDGNWCVVLFWFFVYYFMWCVIF